MQDKRQLRLGGDGNLIGEQFSLAFRISFFIPEIKPDLPNRTNRVSGDKPLQFAQMFTTMIPEEQGVKPQGGVAADQPRAQIEQPPPAPAANPRHHHGRHPGTPGLFMDGLMVTGEYGRIQVAVGVNEIFAGCFHHHLFLLTKYAPLLS